MEIDQWTFVIIILFRGVTRGNCGINFKIVKVKIFLSWIFSAEKRVALFLLIVHSIFIKLYCKLYHKKIDKVIENLLI